MRKVVAFALMVLLLLWGCASQSPQEQFNDKAYIKNRLSLTDEQESSYWVYMARYDSEKQAILEKYRGQGPRDKKDSQDGLQALRGELKALRGKAEKDLEFILAEKQIKEWCKLMDEQEQKMKERKPQRGGPPGGFGGPR
ncbi:MAG: hypothetical protein V1701_07130 [Planctomycetota bacterium]